MLCSTPIVLSCNPVVRD
ncbi:UNVERIFIED_CONTAM: hypothetical protein GTU68_009817 [Idotea baltica]|nr:hypothetical protein [Idotea baltica]